MSDCWQVTRQRVRSRAKSRIDDRAAAYNLRPGNILTGVGGERLPQSWRAILQRERGLVRVRAFRDGWIGFRRWYVLEGLDAHARPWRARVFADYSAREILAVEWRRQILGTSWPPELQNIRAH